MPPTEHSRKGLALAERIIVEGNDWWLVGVRGKTLHLTRPGATNGDPNEIFEVIFVSPKSTAVAAFTKNFEELVREVELVFSAKGRDKVVNVTYSSMNAPYRFIEHEVQRMRNKNIPPSHIERLSSLNVSWGSDVKLLSVIFGTSAAFTGMHVHTAS